MKRILIMLSVLILAIGFSACGKKSAKDISSDKAESAASDTFIEVEPTGNETNNEPPTSGNVADGTVTVSDAGSSASAGKQHPAHTYKKAVVPATCEKDGFTKYTCDCGASYTDDTVLATGHKYGD